MTVITTSMSPMLVAFPAGVAHPTSLSSLELADMAEDASGYILEEQPFPLQSMLDAKGIPRHHHPKAVRQLADGWSMAAQEPLPEERVERVINLIEAALKRDDVEATAAELRDAFRELQLIPVTKSFSGWDELTKSYAVRNREAEIIRRAAYQVYCDGPLHAWLQGFGGFVQTTTPRQFLPLVEAGLAVYVGRKGADGPVEGLDSFVALLELSAERAERLIEGIVAFCSPVNRIGLAPQAIVAGLMEIPEVARLLQRRILTLLKKGEYTEEEMDYYGRLPAGFAEEICESLCDEGLIRLEREGVWSLIKRAPQDRNGKGSDAP